jgi:hypothetical protein
VRTIKRLSVAAVLAAGTMLSLSAPASANLVTNGNFDADSPDSGVAPLGWTLVLAPSGSDFFVGSGPGFGPFSPPNSANFGATGGFDDVLSQVLSTTPGQAYTISFELAHDSTNNVNDFSANFGTNQILSLTNTAEFAYTLYSFTDTATSSSTTISFAGRENPAWYDLDNVDVEVATAVPEPGSLAVFGAALFGLGMLSWRRRKAA